MKTRTETNVLTGDGHALVVYGYEYTNPNNPDLYFINPGQGHTQPKHYSYNSLLQPRQTVSGYGKYTLAVWID